MAFNLKESYWGIRHLIRSWERKFLKQPAHRFITGRKTTGNEIKGSQADLRTLPNNPEEKKQENEPDNKYCERCGYALLTLHLDQGWIMECCSSLPLAPLSSADFPAWVQATCTGSLPKEAQQPILQE